MSTYNIIASTDEATVVADYTPFYASRRFRAVSERGGVGASSRTSQNKDTNMFVSVMKRN